MTRERAACVFMVLATLILLAGIVSVPHVGAPDASRVVAGVTCIVLGLGLSLAVSWWARWRP